MLLIILPLAGCTHTARDEKADEPWPELADQAEDCNGLSGIYAAQPQLHQKTSTEPAPLLAYTLLPASPKLAEADRVRLKVTSEQLIVTAFSGITPLVSETYHSESGIFECASGTLEFRPGAKPGAEASTSTPGIDWEAIRLRRTQDKSLLLQKADGLANLAFMLFPIYLTTDNWYLFKPMDGAPEKP